MALNQEQQLELSRILDSDLFRRASEEVRAIANIPVIGMQAPEAGIAMAFEKGVNEAFAMLRVICLPRKQPGPPPLSNTIIRTKTRT